MFNNMNAHAYMSPDRNRGLDRAECEKDKMHPYKNNFCLLLSVKETPSVYSDTISLLGFAGHGNR